MLLRLITVAFVVASALAAQSVGVQIVPGEGKGQAVPSEAQAAELQEHLRNDPNDLDAHLRLAFYYDAAEQGPPLVQEVLWLINNHPESAGVSAFVSNGLQSFTTAADYALVKAAWESALAINDSNPHIEYIAGLFFQSSDANRALALFSQAHELDHENYSFVQAEANIYRKAIQPDALDLQQIQAVLPQQASALKTALSNSSDAMLVGLVGERLAMEIWRLRDCTASCKTAATLGQQLLQQAINLQPDNPRWQHALRLSKQIASGQMPLAEGPQRIGGAVMEANLLTKVDPVYPPLALSARVQGTVEFTATIDETGHVANLQLVRGHPLLVNAAREAVLQWTYRPTLLNGQPVTVITNVIVNFTLPRSSANPAQSSQPPK